MPIGVALTVGAVAGGIGFFAGKKSGAQPSPVQASNTTGLVDAATAAKPPNAIQGASEATAQATIAASKQRKKAAAGDTLLTPKPPAGGWNSGTAGAPKPASLVGAY